MRQPAPHAVLCNSTDHYGGWAIQILSRLMLNVRVLVVLTVFVSGCGGSDTGHWRIAAKTAAVAAFRDQAGTLIGPRGAVDSFCDWKRSSGHCTVRYQIHTGYTCTALSHPAGCASPYKNIVVIGYDVSADNPTQPESTYECGILIGDDCPS